MAANAAAERIGDAALVCCGGDVAVAGETPEGWRVRVSERPGHDEWQDVLVHDGGVATSGVASRSWTRGHTVYHHILDPATGLPVVATWRTVSVAAATCAQANAAATAAIILGELAVPWLQQRELPARLVGMDGGVTIIDGWPVQD
jgi:thiamine biosynthesis lipoprotein